VRASAVAEPIAASPAEEEVSEPRRRWWKRRDVEDDTAPEHTSDAPRHVRVIGPDEQPSADVVDPWEQGFDTDTSIGRADPPAEPEEETDENEAAVAAEAESEQRRRFRRR
jgi:hypothetical protein